MNYRQHHLREVILIITTLLLITHSYAQKDGVIDQDFGIGGEVFFADSATVYGRSFVIQNDGTIVFAHTSVGLNSDTTAISVTALNPDGSLKYSFGDNGSALIHKSPNFIPFFDIVKDLNDRLIVIGSMGRSFNLDQYVFIARLMPDGSIDNTFGNDGYATLPVRIDTRGTNLLLSPTGKIAFLENFQVDSLSGDRYNSVWQLHADGAPDSTFGIEGELNLTLATKYESVRRISYFGDTNLLGIAQDTISRFHNRLFKFDRLGFIDQDFGTNGSTQIPIYNRFSDAINHILIEDNNIYLSGSSDFQRSSVEMLIVKLSIDGSYDSTFASDGIRYIDINNRADIAWKSILKSDGKLLVAGLAAAPNITGGDNFAIVRLNPDGTNDNTFGESGIVYHTFSSSIESFAFDIALPATDKILVFGNVTMPNSREIGFLSLEKDQSDALVPSGTNHQDVAIYPNPGFNNYSISLEKVYTKIVVRVRDSSGRTLGIKEYSNTDKIQSAIEGNPGVYFLELYADQEYLGSFKLVKN